MLTRIGLLIDRIKTIHQGRSIMFRIPRYSVIYITMSLKEKIGVNLIGRKWACIPEVGLLNDLVVRAVRDEADFIKVSELASICLSDYDEYYKSKMKKCQERWPEVFFLVEDKNTKQVVGFCIFKIVPSFSFSKWWVKNATLFSLALHPQYRDKGVANVLLPVLLNNMALNGIGRSDLFVDYGNDRAIALYKRHGYKIARIYRGVKKDNKDLIFMVNDFS